MRYVLDTNVLSEVMKPEPHPAVAGWLRACPAEAMFTTAISRGEIVYGIRRLPDGIRRRRLERAAMAMFAEEFTDCVLLFDAEAADLYADLRPKEKSLPQELFTQKIPAAPCARLESKSTLLAASTW